jgi:hypothetical protein
MKPQEMSQQHWDIAHAIALEVVLDETDINELKKAISYLRTIAHREDLGRHFLTYYQTLLRHGRTISHSQKTEKYYKSILDIFDYYLRQCLKQQFNNFQVVCEVLGWSARLAQYYKPEGKFNDRVKAELGDLLQQRQDSIRNQSRNFTVTPPDESNFNNPLKQVEVGQILDAVATKKGSRNRVTYECLGQTFSEREARNYNKIPLNQPINVEVKSLKDDGSINHIKFTKNSS